MSLVFSQRDYLELIFRPKDSRTCVADHDVQHFGENAALPALSQGVYISDRTDQQKPVSCSSLSLERGVWRAWSATSTRSVSDRPLPALTYLAVFSSLSQRFFAALLTAVLTYHLAWVPTVMPIDHPPIKAFSEKRTSQSVSALARTHPYNPLWAQLGQCPIGLFSNDTGWVRENARIFSWWSLSYPVMQGEGVGPQISNCKAATFLSFLC